MLVHPGVSLQPLTPNADHLRPLQHADLQLERQRHLPKVPQRPTLEGVSEEEEPMSGGGGGSFEMGSASLNVLPLLREVHVPLGQDGQDLVEHLVGVGVTRQGHVVLGLEGTTH